MHKSINKGFSKFEIQYSPNIIDKETLKSKEKFRDSYYSGFGKFIFTKSAYVEGVPASLNGLIVFHEFAHAIWDYKRKFTPDKSDFIKGLNEGFADWISYSITGSTNILKASQYEKKNSNIQHLRDFSTFNYSLDDLKNIELCSSMLKYCLGSVFANALYKAKKELDVTLGKDSRHLISRKIVNSIDKILVEDKNILGDFLDSFSQDDIIEATIKKHILINFNFVNE